MPIRLVERARSTLSSRRCQWGLFIKISSDISTVVLPQVLCIGSCKKFLWDPRSFWQERRGPASDLAFEETKRKFGAHPVASILDVELLNLSNPNSGTSLTPRR